MTVEIPQPEFGQRLRKLRNERGMSQRDLAVGTVNQSYISLIESGARVPTLEVVLHLARVLDVPLTALVEGAPLQVSAPAPAPTAQLAEELLITSAIDHGDLTHAQQRLDAVYQAARESGTDTAILSHGLVLERILELRNDRPARYQLLTELFEVAQRLDIPEAVVRTRVALSAAARDVGQLAEAFAHIERAEQEIADTGFVRGPEHVRLLAVHISVLSDAGGGVEVSRIVDRMLAMADDLGAPAVSGRAHWVASIALARIGEVDASLEHLREARKMLAHPSTSLHDWARFSRAAASALMDASAELSEITTYMMAARAASEALSDPAVSTSLEVRYALASGDPKEALKIAAGVDESELAGIERVRFVVAVGRAQRQCGRHAEAVETLHRAAELAEAAAAYRRATQIWREATEAAVPDQP